MQNRSLYYIFSHDKHLEIRLTEISFLHPVQSIDLSPSSIFQFEYTAYRKKWKRVKKLEYNCVHQTNNQKELSYKTKISDSYEIHIEEK